jgi:hypothetical protein
MHSGPIQSDIPEIAHLLAMRRASFHPTVLFLGARSGGLFRSLAFSGAMERFSTRNFAFLSPQDQFAESYRVLHALQSSENELYSHLKEFLRDVTITDADICLAELVKQRLFSVIVSTNIDDVLERAFSEVEMREPHDFDVVIPERGPEPELGYPERRLYCRIIKAFGDLNSRSYILVKRHTYLDANQKLKKLLEDALARDVLVVGLDAAWDEEVIRAFLPRASSLWFVNEDRLLDHPLVSRLCQGRQQVRYIAGQEGSYEAFFKALHWHLAGGMPMNYQFTRDILSRLQVIASNQRSLYTEIHRMLLEHKREMALLRQELSDLKQKFDILPVPLQTEE